MVREKPHALPKDLEFKHGYVRYGRGIHLMPRPEPQVREMVSDFLVLRTLQLRIRDYQSDRRFAFGHVDSSMNKGSTKKSVGRPEKKIS